MKTKCIVKKLHFLGVCVAEEHEDVAGDCEET